MIGRESELRALNERYDSGRFEMIPVFGRRRVGKTTLLKEFIKGRNGVYFSATRGSLDANISKLASKVLGASSPVSMSLDDLLDEIRIRSQKERYVLIIDEYPNLIRRNDHFSDVLQEFIDDIEDDSKLFLILCGSSISIMRHQVLSSQSPIYGRRTGQLEVLPMDIWDTMRMLEGFRIEDVMRIYGIVGGIPLYLKMFDPGSSVRDNIIRLFFEDTSFFRNEHEFVLMEEFCRTADEPLVEEVSDTDKARAKKFFPSYGTNLAATRLGVDRFKKVVERLESDPESRELVCECENVTRAEVEEICKDDTSFIVNDVRRRTRIGMGTCQGNFCALRAAAVFADMGVESTSKDSLTRMREFLQGRWKGIRPVLLGRTLRETEMTRSIYELSMNVTGGDAQ